MVKKIWWWLVGLISLISVVLIVTRLSGNPLGAFLNPHSPAGLKVLSSPEGAAVFINGSQVGKTPYEDANLDEGEKVVKLTSGEALWQGQVKLTAGTLAVVNRDLSKDKGSSGGEVLTLERGKGVTIISSPPQAEVEIDGKSFGQTPLSASLEVGDHTLAISYGGYLKRSIRANLPEQFSLNLTVDLVLSEDEASVAPSPSPAVSEIRLVVKTTPTGFLRVRDKPSLAGAEVARVSPGDELILLEEQASWDKVRLADGKEGYVSTSYVEKKK